MPSRLFKRVVWLIKFYHRIYVNLWLCWRGYRLVSAADAKRVRSVPQLGKKHPPE